MIKLFTLKNLSPFSADAVFKICLALEQFGLKQSQVKEFESYDELYFESIVALEQGEHIIVAAENEDYNSFKREIIAKFILEEYTDEEITAVIEKNAGEDIAEIDVTGHSLVARGSICHFSRDGLFCGFTCDALLGKVTCIPLDFMRVDKIVKDVREKVLMSMASSHQSHAVSRAMPEFDFLPHIGEIVSSLKKSDSTMAFSTGEASMWIYNYYDKIEGFNERLRFVEVIDEEENEDEITAGSESVKVIRHAKEAMTNAGSDFGGAISDVYSSVDEKGQTVYFAYAAVVDKTSAKAKKINTSNPEDLALILPHAVTILTELVKSRVSVILKQREEELYDVKAEYAAKSDNKQEEKLSKKMLIFGAIVIAVAVISPILMVALFFGGNDKNEGTSDGGSPVYNAGYVNQTESSSNSSEDITLPSNVTEPTIGNISVTTTQSSVSSTSGTFTFDVFGYGHGVGLSQEGADYLASRQSWSWSEILAHYYCCEDGLGQIVFGDAMPETISYGGTSYITRDFLASVLEAEMGSAFHDEALKAQFVAIYTFAKYYNFSLNRDACAILGSGKTPSSKIYSIVDEMMAIGAYIEYNGKCALTPFHAMSAGQTTSYYNTWGNDPENQSAGVHLNYLSGARLSYGDTLADEYRTSFTISSEELKKIIEANFTDEYGNKKVELTGDPSTWLSVISHDGALGNDVGYVYSIRVGDEVISGNDFRIKVLEGRIRSHCFYITYTPSTSTVS